MPIELNTLYKREDKEWRVWGYYILWRNIEAAKHKKTPTLQKKNA